MILNKILLYLKNNVAIYISFWRHSIYFMFQIFSWLLLIIAIIDFNKLEFLKNHILQYNYVCQVISIFSYWNLSSIAAYSSKKRVGTSPDRYHLKREAISITISERIGTRVVIEYGLSAQKWKLLQEPCTV